MNLRVVGHYDIGKNFWKDNSHLLALNTFRQLYESDKSLDKEESSDLMWWIYFCYDYESRYSSLPPSERKKLIQREWIDAKYKGTDDYASYKNLFDNKKIKPFVDLYIDLQTDSKRKYLESWRKKLDDRTLFLNTTNYDAQVAQLLDKMLLDSVKLMKQEKEMIDEIAREEQEIKGGQKLSAFVTNRLKAELDPSKQDLENHGFTETTGTQSS